MLENEMQFRMDLEKLKAQVAEHERRLEDQEEVGDPPLAVEAGSGIEVQAVAGAWRVSATGETGETADIVVAKITGGTTLTGYDITCYPAYPSKAASYAAKLSVPEIALGTELPVNTYIIAHKKAVEIMGGTPA